MGEFDLSLIREFRSRPAFYDRNEPRFKDKIFTAREWQEISNKLGYDVSLLKDRMLQLRNRYNLEKRRLEQLRDENPGQVVESPWPLYDQLHFLSDHIRARRSYKRMMPLYATARTTVAADISNSGSNRSSFDDGGGAAEPAGSFLPNGLLSVKMEEDDSDDEHGDGGIEVVNGDAEEENDTDADSTQTNALRGPTIHSATTYAAAAGGHNYSQRFPAPVQPAIAIRRVDSLQGGAAGGAGVTISGAVVSRSQKRPHSAYVDQRFAGQSNFSVKQMCLNPRDHKYAAFGNFISSSLQEMPRAKALQLVEKFTSEVVKSLMKKSDPPVEAIEAETLTNGETININP